MLPTLNIRCAIRAFTVAHRYVHNLEPEFGSPKQQVKITEWIKITKVGTIGSNKIVVRLPEHLGAAEGIFDGLSQQPRKGQAKKLIPDQVQELHGLFF